MERPAGTPTEDPDATDWPIPLRGVTETIIATQLPDGTWNQAAFGVHAGDPPWARSWGETTTRRNLARTNHGIIQCLTDPRSLVEAALDTYITDQPVLESTAGWVRVTASVSETGTSGGTEWVEWALHPTASATRQQTVPSLRRAPVAVVEAAVAASRLTVDAYDTTELRDRLAYLETFVNRTGTDRDIQAFDRIVELSAWDGI